MPARPTLFVALLGLAVTGATCRSGDPKEPDPPSSDTPAPADDEAEDDRMAVTEIPGIDLAEIDPAVRADALRILNDTYCYCGCPRTVAACLASRQDCSCVHCSERMAHFVMNEYKNGASTEDVEHQLLSGFSEGFNGPPKTFDEGEQPTKGPSEAQFTIVEFADFACPHCAGAFGTLNALLAKRSDVKLTYYYFPLSFNGDKSIRAAEAAEEARRQGKFWEMAEMLFNNQLALSEADLMRYAEKVGLNMADFSKAMKERTHKKKVMKDKRLGESSGVESTPSLFVNGRPFGLARTLENFDMRLQMEAERGTCN